MGQVAAVRPASAIDAASLSGVVEAELATFITKARLVTPDQRLKANRSATFTRCSPTPIRPRRR